MSPHFTMTETMNLIPLPFDGRIKGRGSSCFLTLFFRIDLGEAAFLRLRV